MFMEMLSDIASWLKDDHIKLRGGKYIRALSLMWCIIRLAQAAIAIGAFYGIYIGTCLLCG